MQGAAGRSERERGGVGRQKGKVELGRQRGKMKRRNQRIRKGR